MEPSLLDEMLKVLRRNGVSAFRNKKGEDFLEIIMVPGDIVEEDEDGDEMDDVSPYDKTGIGITYKSFQQDKDDAESFRRNVIRDIK